MSELGTKQEGYQLLREQADEDASPIDLTTQGDFAQKPAGAIEIQSRPDGLGSQIRDIFLMLCAGPAAGKTFTWRLFTWAKSNGAAQLVAYGTGTLGTQQVVKYPDDGSAATSKFWADTLTVTAFYWPKTVKATPGGGNNSIAMITLDTLNYAHWFMQIESADGSTGDEAGDVSCYWKKK